MSEPGIPLVGQCLVSGRECGLVSYVLAHCVIAGDDSECTCHFFLSLEGLRRFVCDEVPGPWSPGPHMSSCFCRWYALGPRCAVHGLILEGRGVYVYIVMSPVTVWQEIQFHVHSHV